MFWGLSESLDLYHEYILSLKKRLTGGEREDKPETPKSTDDNVTDASPRGTEGSVAPTLCEDEDIKKLLATSDGTPETVNILLLGANDPRHILKTVAKLYTHSRSNEKCDGRGCAATPQINFYLIEGSADIVARDIALMAIAMEQSKSFNLQNQVDLFMDLYGNSLLRPSSHHYLVSKAKTLTRMFTDRSELERIAPMIRMDLMRYTTVDNIVDSFGFWCSKPKNHYDIQQQWDGRLRRALKTRYDHKTGVFDWDLSMTLKGRGAQQICSQEYRHWRETGIAFTFPEYEQCKPNKTLVAGLRRQGDEYRHLGYVGDIETGPFCAFGLKTTDESMMRSAHGENDYRATDVTQRNLMEIFHELKTRSPYVHDPERSRKYGSVRLLITPSLVHEEFDGDAAPLYDDPWLPIDGVKVHLLSFEELRKLQMSERRWENFFNVGFIGYNFFNLVEKEKFMDMMAANALVIFETILLTPVRKEKFTAFENRIFEYAKKNNLQSLINYKALNSDNTLLKFYKGLTESLDKDDKSPKQ